MTRGTQNAVFEALRATDALATLTPAHYTAPEAVPSVTTPPARAPRHHGRARNPRTFTDTATPRGVAEYCYC